MSGVAAVVPVVLRSYLGHAAKVVGATVLSGDDDNLVAVVRRGEWAIWLRLTDQELIGTLVHTSWGPDDDDLLFRSPLPTDVVGVGLWARRHAANVMQRLEATPQEGVRDDDPLRILVVDDEQIARWSMGRLLHMHHVEQAADAAQARALLEGETFDGILLDVAMPGESGADLLRWLTARRPGVAARVCLVTADPSLAPDAATPLLTKPFSRAELDTVLAWFAATRSETDDDPPTPPTLCALCGRGHRSDEPCRIEPM